MTQSLLIGAGGIIGLMLIWVAVQTIWRRTFADHISEDDVLAGRTRCSNCGCTTICRNKDGKYAEG